MNSIPIPQNTDLHLFEKVVLEKETEVIRIIMEPDCSRMS